MAGSAACEASHASSETRSRRHHECRVRGHGRRHRTRQHTLPPRSPLEASAGAAPARFLMDERGLSSTKQWPPWRLRSTRSRCRRKPDRRRRCAGFGAYARLQERRAPDRCLCPKRPRRRCRCRPGESDPHTRRRMGPETWRPERPMHSAPRPNPSSAKRRPANRRRLTQTSARTWHQVAMPRGKSQGHHAPGCGDPM